MQSPEEIKHRPREEEEDEEELSEEEEEELTEEEEEELSEDGELDEGAEDEYGEELFEEEDFGYDIGGLLSATLATEEGDTVCSALVTIGEQLATQNKILLKILTTLSKKTN